MFNFEVATLEPNRRGEKAPGARRFVAQNGFCGTKTHLAGPQNRRCPYPEHLHSIHASVREGVAR